MALNIFFCVENMKYSLEKHQKRYDDLKKSDS